MGFLKASTRIMTILPYQSWLFFAVVEMRCLALIFLRSSVHFLCVLCLCAGRVLRSAELQLPEKRESTDRFLFGGGYP